MKMSNPCLTCNDTGTYQGAIGIKRTDNTADFNSGQALDCPFCKPQQKAVKPSRAKTKNRMAQPKPSKQDQMELL